MRITTATRTRTIRLSVLRHVVLCGGFAMAACQDVTAPEKVEATPQVLGLTLGSATDEIASLASNLDDFTGWSLAALPDAKGKASIVGILSGLKGHLNSGKIAACQQDVTDARLILGSLSAVEQVEVGSIGVALDVIQAALDRASQ